MNNSEDKIEERIDRLSALPDDILIRILSCLPIQFCVVTEEISRRWRGLWKNVTSIHLDNNTAFLEKTYDLFRTYDKIIPQITSPFIHSFSVDLREKLYYWQPQPSINYWLSLIFSRNTIRELKLIGHFSCQTSSLITLPIFITQTQSLESIVLSLSTGLGLPEYNGSINLPNLRNLKLDFETPYSESLENLIRGCPLLEQLSLICLGNSTIGYDMKCSNLNLRRLIIHCYTKVDRIEIKAPNLEFLSFQATMEYVTICFDQEPIVFREAKIDAFQIYFPKSEAIHNVKVLELTATNFVNNTYSVFRNLNRLTIDMEFCHNIKTVLTFVELCPVLDFLKLMFWDITLEEETLEDAYGYRCTLERVLESIEIEASWWRTHCRPTKSFIGLVAYLLSNAIDLKYFHFRIVGIEVPNESLESKEREELKLCRLLYRCPMVSSGCEVEFAGRYFNMSRKAGPKAWKDNGEIVDLLSMDIINSS